MTDRSHRILWAALAFVAASSAAQTLPGVGYEPGPRGLSLSGYKLDSLSNRFTYYAMNMSADPGAVGAHPNPYYLDISDPLVQQTYEMRYGPGTIGPRMKSWIGPNNEVRPVLVDALQWWFANRPQGLGGSTVGRNGVPTEREIIDVQATGDRDIWQFYLIASTPGFSADNREVIDDPSLPPGDGQRMNVFWNMTNYFHNTFTGYYPFSPQVAIPPSN
ncbi:MAG: hypothetical protein ABI609_13050 [Acidobacteriota bacterium]